MKEIYSGYDITLNKLENRAYKGKMLKIEGASKQETREGYNKFNLEKWFNNAVASSCTKTLLENGVKLDFTAGVDAFIGHIGSAGSVLAESVRECLTDAEASKEYTISLSSIPKCYIGYYDESYTSLGYIALNSTKTTFTTPANTKYISLRLGIQDSNYTTYSFTNIQIVEGTKEKPYEQYGVSPSIEHEAPIESVGDNINEFDISQVAPSINCTVNNEIITSNILNGNNQYMRFKTNEMLLKANKTYYFTLKAKIDSGTYSGQVAIQAFNNSTIINAGTFIDVPVISSDYQEYKYSITPSEDSTLNLLLVQLGQNATNVVFSIKDIKISKVKGGEYSPYGQGSIEIEQTNENFLNLNKLTLFSSNKYISTIDYTNKGLIKVVPNTTYSLVRKDIGAFSDGGYYLYDNNNANKKTISVKTSTNGNYRVTTFTTNSDSKYFGFYLGGQTIVYSSVEECLKQNEMMLLLGDYSTMSIPEYVEHQSQIKTLYTQQPFRAIGDVKDRFVKQNGVWYEEHNIARKIFDGTDTLHSMSTSGNSLNFFGFSKVLEDYKYIDANTLNFACNCFVAIPVNDRYKDNTIFINPNPAIVITSNNFASNDELLAKLVELYEAGTPMYLDYELATPTLIPCTPVQSVILDELENMKLYDGKNYIYSINEVQPMLTLELYYMMEDYDLYVSSDGYLNIPGIDIKFLINFMESSLPTMPEAVEASVRAAGRDGDYVLNTTYEPIPFEIVCYTQDNLTVTQKKEIESKVNRFLNSIKNKTKRLAFERDNKFYNVKYNNLAVTTNYPAHLKFAIPLKSSESYAKDTFEKIIAGNNSEISDTINPTGALITINGPATLPIIALNDYSMEYDTVILEGARLEIDTSKSTATHINSDGVKTNVMGYYNHQFPKIEPGENTLKVLSGIDDEYNVTVKWNDLKL